MVTKAIPPARDRLQSRILVGIVTPALCYASYLAIRDAIVIGRLTDSYLWRAVLLSACFAYVVWRLKAATPSAAACGGMIAFLVTLSSSIPENISPFHSGLTPLILLFIATFAATRLGRARKHTLGLAEPRRGRTAGQIIANLGVASLISSPLSRYIWGWFVPIGYSSREGHKLFVVLICVPMLAALAEASADTVSSELGQAFGGVPILATTFRRVAPGTDGAITLMGTVSGIAAAAIVAASAVPAIGMTPMECTIAFLAGVCGLFFDTLLGATIERLGYLGNDLVNFLSTAFASAISLVATRMLLQRLL